MLPPKVRPLWNWGNLPQKGGVLFGKNPKRAKRKFMFLNTLGIPLMTEK